VVAIPPIRTTEVPMKLPAGTKHLDWSWKAVGEPNSTQAWTDDGTKVEIRFFNSYSVDDWFAFRVNFSPVTTISWPTPIPLTIVFDDWLEPLRRLIALSTSRRERLTYVSLELATNSAQPELPLSPECGLECRVAGFLSFRIAAPQIAYEAFGRLPGILTA
jgi:hypothetical protein